MIEKIRKYLSYVRKQRSIQPVNVKPNTALYWKMISISFICFVVSVILLFYGYYLFSALAVVASLSHYVYVTHLTKYRIAGDLLILLDFIVFGIGACLSNGLYSPFAPLLIALVLAVNQVGYYIKTIETVVIGLLVLLFIYVGNIFEVFPDLIDSSLSLEFLFYFIAMLMSGLYIIMHDFNRHSTDHKQRKLDQLKSEWVSVVSHELRTPLTAIRGAMGLIHSGLAGELSPQAKELVKIANSNCERLTRLVNDILDIEKMEQGLVSLNLKPSDLNVIIQDAVSTYQAQAIESQIELVLELDSPSMILADRDRVTQVVQNLISNALKFSPRQSKVVIKAHKKSTRVRVDVIDFGTGIPKEFQPQIFQKFTQADSSASRQTQGSGLGLAICRSLIALHDGSIGFEPNNTNGAVFWFELPLYRSL